MRANTSVVIPQHIREALDKSPNASAHNNIIVCKLNEKLYAARWNLQPHEMELDQLWETTTNEPCTLNHEPSNFSTNQPTNRTMNTTTPTPRTDAIQELSYNVEHDEEVALAFTACRTLERELTAVTEQRDEARKIATEYRNAFNEAFHDDYSSILNQLPWENNQPTEP